MSECLSRDSNQSSTLRRNIVGEMRNVFFHKPQKKRGKKSFFRVSMKTAKEKNSYIFFHHRRHHRLLGFSQWSTQLKITNPSSWHVLRKHRMCSNVSSKWSDKCVLDRLIDIFGIVFTTRCSTDRPLTSDWSFFFFFLKIYDCREAEEKTRFSFLSNLKFNDDRLPLS